MAQTVTLTMDEKKIIRSVDPLMMSYNVEFAEVTGGTFWREYTPGQIAGTEPFSYVLDENGQPDPMQVYPPVNLYDEKLRSLVKALGPAWVRLSGTWATKTYYDFDGTTGRCGSANPAMCAPVITLNGHRLVLGAGNELPDLSPETVPDGTVTIAPGGCTFFIL